MKQTTHDASGLLIRKLERLASLGDADRAALEALTFRERPLTAGTMIVREGDAITDCSLLLEGVACRNKMLRNGSRQIVSFHMAGDVLDVQQLLLDTADHNVQAITPVVVASVPADELRQLVEKRPSIARAFWRDSLIEASIFREWVLNVGRRDARSRVAHLLCEFAVRREAAGLGAPERFKLPLTQEHIADATGLTPVHVNRMMAALRAAGLIAQQGRELQITDWPGLQAVAEFDPIYLHVAA